MEAATLPAESSSPTADREIVITRVFEAPRELVFKAWTDPQQIDQWWGPTGFVNETFEMDVRPSGVWRYMMRSKERGDYPNMIVYQEVAEPERLIYDHGSDADPFKPEFHVTVTFADEGGKTRLTMRSLFPTAEARDYVIREVKAIEGGNQTLDRLGKHLANM